jgi:hypothetical protein
MNTIARVSLVAMLAFAFGCAKPDWIQQTLVTVDVTGVWIGPMGTSNSFSEVRLELEQQGPKVKGTLRRLSAGSGLHPLLEGPIDGALSGDVFSFRLANGSAEGEMTVSADEMRGFIRTSSRVPISLRRADSSAAPRSQ